jgi:hypothetical protein
MDNGANAANLIASRFSLQARLPIFIFWPLALMWRGEASSGLEAGPVRSATIEL